MRPSYSAAIAGVSSVEASSSSRISMFGYVWASKESSASRSHGAPLKLGTMTETSGAADCRDTSAAPLSAMALTCSTLADTHAHPGILFQQVAEDTSKRLLAERRKAGGLEKGAASLAIGHDLLAIEGLQK